MNSRRLLPLWFVLSCTLLPAPAGAQDGRFHAAYGTEPSSASAPADKEAATRPDSIRSSDALVYPNVDPEAAYEPKRHEHRDGTEPLLTRLRSALRTPYFNLNVLARTEADFFFDTPPDGRNGFRIGSTRIAVHGALDHGFSYFVQTDLTQQPVLLDARLSYNILDNARVNFGLFKPPFSYEFMLPDGDLDMVRRSQAVRFLAPTWQIGGSFDGRSADGLFNISVGMFNGNGPTLTGNDNNRFMYVGRVSVTPRIRATPQDRMEIGVNAAYNDVRIGNTRDILYYGGDLRVELAPIMLSAEAIQRDVRMPGDVSRSDFGYQATLGLWLTPDHQVLIRWDSFLPEDPAADSNFVILGSNFWPTTPFKLQLNYLIPTEDAAFENHRVMLNFQVSI